MKRAIKHKKLAIRHRGRIIMAKHKSKSHHDDGTSVDDEPEAGWTEDTHAEQHEGEPPPEGEQPPPPPVAPPAARLNAVIAQLNHSAAHNAAIPPGVLDELQSIAAALTQDEGAPTMPVIDSMQPTTAPEGTLVLVVTGRNFSPASVLCYGDVNQNTQVSTDLTQLTATFESGPPGTYDVNVHDPAGDANTVQFVVT